MDTLAKRLQWVIDQTGMSARGWSLKAHLAGGHVGLMLRGTAGKRPSEETIAKLAEAAAVDQAWLARGTGSPGLRSGHTPPLHVEHVERYAGRAEAKKAMEGLVDPEANVAISGWNLNATQDPGVLWWIERIKEIDRQLKHWRKNPSAERAELEKRVADTDALDAAYEAHVKASKVAQVPINDSVEPMAPPATKTNDTPPPPANDGAKKPGKKR